MTGAFTNWASGTTKANFGPGIAVGGAAAGAFGPVTVNSATSLTANLVTSGASNGFRTVQIQTGSQTLTVDEWNRRRDLQRHGADRSAHQPSQCRLQRAAECRRPQIQFSVPMNRSTFSLGNTGPATIFFYDTPRAKKYRGRSASTPRARLRPSFPAKCCRPDVQFDVYLSYAAYVQDTCGNNLGSCDFYFYTAFSPNSTGPALTGTSPVNGDTNIPLNGNASGGTPVVLQFSIAD